MKAGRVVSVASRPIEVPAYSDLLGTRVCAADVVALMGMERDAPGPIRCRSRSDVVRIRALLVLSAGWLCSGRVSAQEGRKSALTVGLAAYDAWLRDLERVHRMSRRRREAACGRASDWIRVLAGTAELLESAAGARSGLCARRLRDAAAAAREQAEHVLPSLLSLPGRRPLKAARGVLSAARELAQDMVDGQLEAAARCTGIAARVWDFLRDSRHHQARREEPHERAVLEDLLYLARGGIPPLRIMALQSLMPFDEPRVRAVLEASVYEQAPLVRAAAEWACAEWTQRHAWNQDV